MTANRPHRPAVVAKHGSLPTPSRTLTVDEPALEQAPAKQLDRTLPQAARERTFPEEVATVEHAQSPATTSDAAGVKTTALPRSIFSL